MHRTSCPVVISICGPAGAGKSQLARALSALLGPELCTRVPTDYFIIPANELLATYFTNPLRYDWVLLARVLSLPEGTATSTPDFDFERFQRIADTGGRPFTIRRVMVLDAMEPYPDSDAVILLSVPEHVRRDRVIARDEVWNTRVRDRFHHLDATWAHIQTLMPPCDLELDGTEPLAENAERLANWMVERFTALWRERAPRDGRELVSEILRGEHVTLRPIAPGDAVRLTEILSHPAVAQWWGRWDRARVRREMFDPDDESVIFAIEHDDHLIGLIQYAEENDPDYRHAGIDIFLDPAWHGRGFGSDALRTLARHLIHDRGHHRLTIDPAAANERAIRSYTRVGFRPVGIMRRYERGPDGTWHDGLLMDLLAEEWT